MNPCSEDLFWYWISERHGIYLAKERGEPKPWSEDAIFQKFKFVNVFRKLDRTTVWLLDHTILPNLDGVQLLAFNIAWFRMFNRIETGEALGWQVRWDREDMTRRVRAMATPPFTGAYIIHSEPGEPKVESIVEVCDRLYHHIIHPAFLVCRQEGMYSTWWYLQHVRHVGPFMAYQMVLDMMYCPGLLQSAPDRETWACVGPGALRGLRRLYPGMPPKEGLSKMLELREKSRHSLKSHVPLLDVHDIEFCLCELDKYCRVKFGEGRPRSTYPGL
jgi:5-hmdU DNA kinase-like protein